MRQGIAGREEADETSRIRMVLLGSDTQVITAGEPPTEEEILAFAREANLDETSLKALLLTVPGASLAGTEPEGRLEGDSVLSQPPGVPGPSADLAGTPITSGSINPNVLHLNEGGPLLSGQLSPNSMSSSHLWMRSAIQSAGPGFGEAQAGPAETLGEFRPTRAVAPLTQTINAFRVSVEAMSLSTNDANQSSKDVLNARLTVDPVSALEGSDDRLAARLGLGLKGTEGPVSMEALLKTIQDKKKMTLQDPIKLQLADPTRSPEPWALDVMVDSGNDASDESRTSLGATGALGLESSLRSGGGSMGDGSQQSRPDPNAGPKAMSQQVMQRFGEILGQRLLQQINQGDWKVEIALEPADLGSIQIELEWRKGELEASFKAGQALTRDLLQDGLPRLRETLERAGIDVASVYVGDQGRQQSSSGRPGQSGSGDLKQSQSSDQGNGLEAQEIGPQGLRPDDGRLDVLV